MRFKKKTGLRGREVPARTVSAPLPLRRRAGQCVLGVTAGAGGAEFWSYQLTCVQAYVGAREEAITECILQSGTPRARDNWKVQPLQPLLRSFGSTFTCGDTGAKG